MPAGRPRKEINRDHIERMCAIQCTAQEIAGIYGISVDTLDLRCKEWGFKNFTDFFKTYGADGKASLRRKQFEVADNGSVAMLIWLGKQ